MLKMRRICLAGYWPSPLLERVKSEAQDVPDFSTVLLLVKTIYGKRRSIEYFIHGKLAFTTEVSTAGSLI